MVIRDGANTVSPLIGKYGPCASGSLTLFSSGRSAYLQMVSAVFSVSDKLRIAYKPTDPGKRDIRACNARYIFNPLVFFDLICS